MRRANSTAAKKRLEYLREVFNKFREYLKREYGVALSYICVLEFTQRGIPHLHVLLDRYIPHEWNLLAAHRAAAWDRQEDMFRFAVLQLDEEGYLKCFEVVTDG